MHDAKKLLSGLQKWWVCGHGFKGPKFKHSNFQSAAYIWPYLHQFPTKLTETNFHRVPYIVLHDCFINLDVDTKVGEESFKNQYRKRKDKLVSQY